MRNISYRHNSSFSKGIALLFSFVQQNPQGIREISKRTGMSTSTVYRLVRTLEGHGLLQQDPKTRKYHLGWRLLQLQEPLIQQLDIWQIARPHMLELSEKYGETAQLTQRSGNTAVTIEVIESKEPLRFAPPRGGSVPLHCGAQAKAILAFLPAQELEAYLKSPLRAYTPHTIVNPQALRAELKRIRAARYARSLQELYIGAAGVAVPIFDRNDTIIGSCGVSGPIQRLTGDRMETVTRAVRRHARMISLELGAPDHEKGR